MAQTSSYWHHLRPPPAGFVTYLQAVGQHRPQGTTDYTTQSDANETANAANYKLSGFAAPPTSGTAARGLSTRPTRWASSPDALTHRQEAWRVSPTA
ncbi:hypothetical protein ACFVVU_37435 [Kitasatospora sp. NPDC057965]|uniref:hypothetical protein n=1 Tax=Kitasatospora sp. NPDC057965 TaxID=3346291 RepID=UPI0036DBE293